MTSGLRCAAWGAALLLATASAKAEVVPSRNVLSAITLDLDGDGKPDRAELVQGAGGPFADLIITLAPRDGATPPRQLAFLKKGLVEGHVFSLARNANGALVVHAGCGGCSSDSETTLTIVYRRGRIVVAGVAFDWDTRVSRGTCDIDLLTGQGVTSRDEAKAKPLRAHLAPVLLAAWSPDLLTALCRMP